MARRSFEEWMRAVDAALLKACGMDSRDLPDAAYWDAWDEGCSPSTMARRVLREAW